MEYHSFLPNQITNKSSQNSGGIAQTLSAEIKENGGYVSVEDLEQYEWE
jgi:gamma-glutamyltranspeptidase